MSVKIVYDKRYNFSFFGLEKLHCFQADKFKQIRKRLLASEKFFATDFIQPAVDEKLIYSYLHKDYRDKLQDKNFLAQIVELGSVKYFPYSFVKKSLVQPMLLMTAGTLHAGHLALKDGIAINLGGGFHHASFTHGHGFCIFPDIAILIKELQKKHHCKHIAMIDLDAHQGDGTERAIRRNKQVLIIDFYNYGIFPNDKKAQKFIDVEVQLGAVPDKEYLQAVENIALPALAKFKPEFIIYQAGSDVYEFDPLSQIELSKEAIIRRDRLVIDYARKHNIPLVMLLGGGYHKDSKDIVAQSLIYNFGDRKN